MSSHQIRNKISLFLLYINQLTTYQLSRNSIFAVGQILISISCLFLAYRVLISYVGLEKLGMWSLLMATSSLVRLGDISGGGALARFVAVEKDRNKKNKTVEFIHTVLLTALIFNLVMTFIFFLISDYIIHYLIDPKFIVEAMQLLPYAVSNILLLAVSGVLLSGIDGTQRADQRAIIVSVASLFFLVFTVVLVPIFGAQGFAMALIFQQLFIIVIAWFVLRRHIVGLGWFPYHWRKEIFKITVSFGLKIQATGIAAMLFEPIIKLLLSYSGGLVAIGLYELSSRLVIQVRSLVIAAVQPLIANFAKLGQQDKEEFEKLLYQATKLVFIATIATSFILVLAAPFISFIILDTIKRDFLLMVYALAIGWNINMLASPMYFAALGKGIMTWNLLSHVSLGLVIVMCGIPLGLFGGEAGIILSVIIALIVSTVVTIVGNARALNITMISSKSLLTLISLFVVIMSILILAIALTLHWIN